MDKKKIDLVNAFMQVEGDIKLTDTMYSKDGSVTFSGYKEANGEYKSIKIVLDKDHVEIINNSNSVIEIYECYKEMKFF